AWGPGTDVRRHRGYSPLLAWKVAKIGNAARAMAGVAAGRAVLAVSWSLEWPVPVWPGSTVLLQASQAMRGDSKAGFSMVPEVHGPRIEAVSSPCPQQIQGSEVGPMDSARPQVPGESDRFPMDSVERAV